MKYDLEWFQTLSFKHIDKLFNTQLYRFLNISLNEEDHKQMQQKLVVICFQTLDLRSLITTW